MQTRTISQKELARELRRQAYQRAKEWRAKDPRYLAMKEAAKVRRREAYQEAKARKKAADAAQKPSRAEQSEARAASKSKRREELLDSMRLATHTADAIDNQLVANDVAE